MAMVATLLGLYVSYNPTFSGIDEGGLDFFFNLRESDVDVKEAETVMVMVDEKSLETEYGYFDPIPRRYLAKLIDTLVAKKVKLIAVDIAFFDPLDKLDPQGDSILRSSIRKAGNVSSVSIWYPQEDGERLLQMPDTSFGNALDGVGYANLEIAGGGSALGAVRAVRPYVKVSTGDYVPSFSTVVYCKYKGIDVNDFVENVRNEQWDQLDGFREIPYHNKAMLINYTGPPSIWNKMADGTWVQSEEGKIITYRSSNLTGKASFPEALFKDKVVFIGNGSEFAIDKFVTPFFSDHLNNSMRGAEVHANAFLTLVNQNFIQRAPIWIWFVFLALAFLQGYATVRYGFMGELSVLIVLIAAAWVAGFMAFSSGVWLPAGSMTIALIFTYFAMSIYLAFTEEKTKKQIKSMFQRYAPPEYVDILVQDPSKLELGGEEKVISILFSDIEGFTTISESLEARTLIKLLNEYLDAMTNIVFENGGTLDKYIGDAIVAVFGAPLPQEEHALHACFTALDMQKRLTSLREQWTRDGYPPIKARVGLNTGRVVFGNIGSEIRYDYTGIGDSMNLAARLESANKAFGTYIMVSHNTYEQVRERVITRELDSLVVKGKTQSVKVYQLIARANEAIPDQTKRLIEDFEAALALYRGRSWDQAIQGFEKALSGSPDDVASQLYIDRCRELKANPPDENWMGEFVMRGK